jgi:hypothetical protein
MGKGGNTTDHYSRTFLEAKGVVRVKLLSELARVHVGLQDGSRLLTISSHIQGTPQPWRQRGWRAMQELTLTWDKMLKDMRTFFTSMGKRVIKRQAS